ncbi:unnamed protein product [Oreochromis niloticus]|nr:unnamed protein product [Mustela putorius furo]
MRTLTTCLMTYHSTFRGSASIHSPMEAKIGTEAGQQKVRAWGPGLEGGVVGFSQTKIECDDKGDGWCDMRCWPTEPVFSRLRRTVQAFRAVVWLLENPLNSQLMPSKEEKLL